MRTATFVLSLAGFLLLLTGLLFMRSTAVDAGATIVQNSHPPLPTTPEDFFFAGTQPSSLTDHLASADSCNSCHGSFEPPDGQPPEHRIWDSWSGSMMAQSARDPLFYAALDLANAAADGTGEWCIRCHVPQAWYSGRSEPSDGTAFVSDDLDGVQCSICHRMVDPVYSAENPAADVDILSAIDPPLETLGSGALILDPLDRRRGPREEAQPLHQWAVSPYHNDSALCGSCHDINNPLLSWDETAGEYLPNPAGEAVSDQSDLFPIERTYSEWLISDFSAENTTCQDCHMQPVYGQSAVVGEPYDDLALHDLTGGNTWVPKAILCEAGLYPGCEQWLADGRFVDDFDQSSYEGQARANALVAGIDRARQTLESAAALEATTSGSQLSVRVENLTGHKLPTGYPEGRRMWLQIEGYDAAGNLVYTSGAYDAATGLLAGYDGSDPTLKVYEVKQGISDSLANLIPGLEAGPSFNFALNNQILKDNRIPPRGVTNAELASVKADNVVDGMPAALYADGQYWDITNYALPADVSYGTVRLLYQTTSKEYVDYLSANDPYASTEPPYGGQSRTAILEQLWEQTGRSAPVVMAAADFAVEVMPDRRLYLPALQNE